MFPIPKPADGKLITVGRFPLGGDKYRDAGQEIPEAFDWKALPDLIKVGKIKFVPNTAQDATLPAQLLGFVKAEDLAVGCETRKLDAKGTPADLRNRILAAAGYASATSKPKDVIYKPRPYEASRGVPTPEQLKETAPRPVGAAVEPNSAAEVDALLAKFDAMSIHELRAVGKLHKLDVSPARSRDDLIVALAEAVRPKPKTPQPAPKPGEPKPRPAEPPAAAKPFK